MVIVEEEIQIMFLRSSAADKIVRTPCLRLSRYLARSCPGGNTTNSDEAAAATTTKANMKPRVLVTNRDVAKDAIELLKERCEVIICPEYPAPSRADILTKISGVDAVLWFSKEKIDKQMLDKAGDSLKVIGTMSAGYDHIDVTEAKARGIKIGNVPEALTAAVADLAMGLLLATARRFQEGLSKITRNEWVSGNPGWMMGKDLNGSTVGIVGLGRIGQAIARRLKGFQIRKLFYTGQRPKSEAKELDAEFVSFDDLLKKSDFVILACPLTNETKNLMDAKAFEKMKSSAILVNISRGDVVDQDALIEALNKEKIWGAGLDVMTPEPLPPDHPLLSARHIVLTPHLGSATISTRTAMAVTTVHNILAGLDGRPMLYPL